MIYYVKKFGFWICNVNNQLFLSNKYFKGATSKDFHCVSIATIFLIYVFSIKIWENKAFLILYNNCKLFKECLIQNNIQTLVKGIFLYFLKKSLHNQFFSDPKCIKFSKTIGFIIIDIWKSSLKIHKSFLQHLKYILLTSVRFSAWELDIHNTHRLQFIFKYIQ